MNKEALRKLDILLAEGVRRLGHAAVLYQSNRSMQSDKLESITLTIELTSDSRAVGKVTFDNELENLSGETETKLL